MTKSDLINVVSENSGLSKKDAGKAVDSVFEALSDAMAKGDKIQIVGFGTFSVKKRAERKGVNPRTKKEITIPASTLPSFKAGKSLKDAVSK